MKTKNILLPLLSLFILPIANAQTIKLENGIAFSSLTNKNINLFEQKIYPYNLSIQLDYLEHTWFYLSSSVGYLQKGGKDDFRVQIDANAMLVDKDPTLRINYITINTLFNWKYQFPMEKNKTCFYLGVGPRIDISTNYYYTPKEINELFKSHDFAETPLKTEKIIYGIKCATGFLYNINEETQIGLNFSWLPSFKKVFQGSQYKDKVFTLGISVGYLL